MIAANVIVKPLMRVTPAMAATLTIVDRWIGQNEAASSASTSAFSGRRISASHSAVATRVSLASGLKVQRAAHVDQRDIAADGGPDPAQVRAHGVHLDDALQ